jgi:hypothetical protein
MSRALDLFDNDINYYLGGGQYDLINVVSTPATWTSAVTSRVWHHLAATDDGVIMTLSFHQTITTTRKKWNEKKR